MDYDALKFYLDVVQWGCTVFVGVYVWASGRQRVTRERISELEKDVDGKLDGHSLRLTHIETRIGGLPNRSDVEKIHRRIDTLATTTSEMGGALRGISQTVGLISEHLLNRDK